MGKIDFVIPWVDGSDPSWRENLSHYDKTAYSVETSVRYRDWGTLHYWFRAVEKYAPWVNRIHLIVWGPVPEWLNVAHPKLNIVRHEDYLPAEYLPTFSSHPIELNMHRIDGLEEQFVYFNDDCYLTAPVKPEDFFVDGLPCDSLEEQPLHLNRRDATIGVNSNTIIFLNQHFNKPSCKKAHPSKWFNLRDPKAAFKNLYLSPIHRHAFFGLNSHHLPQAYRKETLKQVWQANPDWLHETSLHKFRNSGDLNQYAFKYWQLASGQFYPINKKKAGYWCRGGTNIALTCDIIRNKRYKYICYNDSAGLDFEANKACLHAAFNDVLPEKSTYER